MIKKYWVYLGRDDDPSSEGALGDRIGVTDELEGAKQLIVNELLDLSDDDPQNFEQFTKILRRQIDYHWFLIFDVEADSNIFQWANRVDLLSTKYFKPND